MIERRALGFKHKNAFWVDVKEFVAGLDRDLAEVETGRLVQSVQLYGGDFLEGFYVRDAPDFESWMLAQRTRYREMLVQCLYTLAIRFADQGQLTQSIAYFRRLLMMEPWREEAHRRLMMVLIEDDQHGAALLQYEICCRALAEELGVEPSPATRMIYAHVQEKETPVQSVSPTLDTSPQAAAQMQSPHTLPSSLMPLVGRKGEQAAICTLLRQERVRLVTLTGPGGVGKTRLAQEVVADLLRDFRDGVFFVSLSALRVPHLVVNAIAQTLGVGESESRSLSQALQEFLQGKEILLVIDNFEHLLTATGLIAELLSGCDQLKMLVTSRELLRLSGEYHVSIPPLPVPEPGLRLTVSDAMANYAAVELFIQCLRTLRPGYQLSTTDIAAIGEICALVDGLPLAIELAAARVRLFSPAALVGHLRERAEFSSLHFLSGGRRDAPERHQSLWHTLDWSYQLLDEDEQALFRRLAVFAGGCTLEAVHAVCSAQGDLITDTLNGLSSLIDKSLLGHTEQAHGRPRFSILETIREYALVQLRDRDDDFGTQHAHARYYLSLTEEAGAQLTGQEQATWLDRLELEHNNLRAALDWALDSENIDLSTRLGAALWHFWYMRGHHEEGWDRLQELARLPGSKAHQAQIQHGMGMLARAKGDYVSALRHMEQSLMLFRELGDRNGISSSLRVSGFLKYTQGDHGAARALLEESLALFGELGNLEGVAAALTNLGYIAMVQGDYPLARSYSEEGLEIRRDSGNRYGITVSLSSLGFIALCQRDYEAARAYLEENLAICDELGNRNGTATVQMVLGHVAFAQGDYKQAWTYYESSLAMGREDSNRATIAHGTLCLGILEMKKGDTAHATLRFRDALIHYGEMDDTQNRCRGACLCGRSGTHAGKTDPNLTVRRCGIHCERDPGNQVATS